MSGKNISIALLSSLIALAGYAPLAVQADEAPAGHPSASAPPDPLARYREAGASPEQLKKIGDMGVDFDQSQKVRLQLLGNLTKQLRALSLQVDPDEKAAVAKQEEINKVVAEMATERIKLMLKIRGMLNAEQKQKLVELMVPRKVKR